MYRVEAAPRLRRKVGAAQDRLRLANGGSCLIPALKIILPFRLNDRRALFNNILIFRMDAQRSSQAGNTRHPLDQVCVADDLHARLNAGRANVVREILERGNLEFVYIGRQLVRLLISTQPQMNADIAECLSVDLIYKGGYSLKVVLRLAVVGDERGNAAGDGVLCLCLQVSLRAIADMGMSVDNAGHDIQPRAVIDLRVSRVQSRTDGRDTPIFKQDAHRQLRHGGGAGVY